jgi:predicted PurR-regulated permease PerM
LIANVASHEATRLCQHAGPQVRAIFEGRLEERLQSHALIRQLHLDNLPLSQTFERLAASGSELLASAIKVVSRETFELIFTLGATFFTMFYFFRDGPRLLARLRHMSPLPDHDQDELLRRLLSVSRATLKGTLLIALIEGGCGGLTFWVFGIQAPVLWGGVMVFLSILPILGPWLVMYPAALILCLAGQVRQGLQSS